MTPKSDSLTRVASFTCFKVNSFHTRRQKAHLCRIPIRHVRGNDIARAPAPLDLRKLQGGPHREWPEYNCGVYEDCQPKARSTLVRIYIRVSATISSNRTSSLSDADAAHFQITAAEKADFLEEFTTEISVYLGMMYHLIEIFKGRDDFADELSKPCAVALRPTDSNAKYDSQ